MRTSTSLQEIKSLFSFFYNIIILRHKDSRPHRPLSRELLIPTVLGMIFSAIFIITDGIFVGKGIGSDALAAVNITAPLFLINTGVALMFGIGASDVASIHLSQGKVKVARINITQAVVVSSLLLIAYAAVILCNVEKIALLLGSSPRLLPLATEYMHWFVPFLVFSALLSSGMFFVRLDGSPNYAMVCNIIPALLNIGLDYLFIFVFKWGMFGAALATSLGYIVGALMILIYLMQPHRVLHLCKVKLSSKSLRLTLRNTGYMCKLGLSSFLCEAAIATMMFTGNYVFIHYLGEDGVAAYSIACYFFPIIFMVYNAIAQSAQPILSYNFGAGNPERVRAAFRLALLTAISCGVVVLPLQPCSPLKSPRGLSTVPIRHTTWPSKDFPCLLPASCASASTLYPSAISRVWNATVRPWPSPCCVVLSSSCSVSG